jgi:hypothetical protein
MSKYYAVPGVDTGVRSMANSADVRGNVRLRLAVGGEAGIVVEEDAPRDVAPRFGDLFSGGCSGRVDPSSASNAGRVRGPKVKQRSLVCAKTRTLVY